MDGLKKAIVYSLSFDDDYSHHHNYKQILKSISSVRKFSNIDILFFYSSRFDISKENFFKDNNVKLIQFNNDNILIRWTEKIPEYPWNKHLHHRWHNIIESLKRFDLDQILYLDTDTIFYKSPEELFNKYNKDIFYLKKEFDDKVVNDLTSSLGIKPAINDGQIIISKRALGPHIEFFTTMLVDKISHFTNAIYDKLNNSNDHILFWNISQYSAFSVIKDLKIHHEYFDEDDISLGINFDKQNKDKIFIHHYFSSNMARYYE